MVTNLESTCCRGLSLLESLTPTWYFLTFFIFPHYPGRVLWLKLQLFAWVFIKFWEMRFMPSIHGCLRSFHHSNLLGLFKILLFKWSHWCNCLLYLLCFLSLLMCMLLILRSQLLQQFLLGWWHESLVWRVWKVSLTSKSWLIIFQILWCTNRTFPWLHSRHQYIHTWNISMIKLSLHLNVRV